MLARVTIEAARALLPLGSAVGTFVPVYASFEKPRDTMINTFANRAHNDFLEGLLESGLVGVVMLGVFLIWFVLNSVRHWRRTHTDIAQTDQLLPRAATIVVALLLAHSLSDYPLRTAAIMVVIAFSCALLLEPRASPTKEHLARAPSSRERQWIEPTFAGAVPRAIATAQSATGVGTPLAAAAPKPRQRWGANVEWPDSWKRPDADSAGRKKSPRLTEDERAGLWKKS
jgi:hypothetical protein